jgi:hypothetical protein
VPPAKEKKINVCERKVAGTRMRSYCFGGLVNQLNDALFIEAA